MSTDSNAQRLIQEAQGIFDAADRQGRALTGDERIYCEGLVERAQQRSSFEKMLGQMPGGGGNVSTDPVAFYGGDPGTKFVQSEGFRRIADPGTRSKSFTTGMIEVSDVPIGMKGTMLEGSGSPGSGSAGGLVPVPQLQPGVVEKLFQPLVLEQLLGANLATGNTVRYIMEGTATSGAAGVAEAGVKPESTIGLSTIDEPIKKVATSIETSDELLEDATAVQAFVNGRLGLFVRIEVERQLLRGTSGGNEVQGILTSRGVPVYAGGTAAGNYAEQIFKAMNGTRGSSFVEPEWIVMHPTDWQVLRLLKDSTGQFMGGGPFLGQYGNGANLQQSGQLSGVADSVWNKAVYVTTAIGGPGTALIGSSQAATVWSRGGLSVEATNSHASNFFLDLVAIRAERRLGLACYRSSAFCEIRLS